MASKRVLVEAPEGVIFENHTESVPRQKPGQIGYNIRIEVSNKARARIEVVNNDVVLWLDYGSAFRRRLSGIGIWLPRESITYMQSDTEGVILVVDGSNETGAAFCRKDFKKYVIKEQPPHWLKGISPSRISAVAPYTVSI
ncbi:hypothetical protein GCM10027299_28780 [Larkinella ripae]